MLTDSDTGLQPAVQDENYEVMDEKHEQPENSEANEDEPKTPATGKKAEPVADEMYAEPEPEDYEVVSPDEGKDKHKGSLNKVWKGGGGGLILHSRSFFLRSPLLTFFSY